jgi:putative transposase
MKKSRYSDSQILAILKQAEAGTPVPALCREHGMSSAAFTNGGPNTAAWMPR